MRTGKGAIYFSITCLGMSALITQIVTLREFMNVLAGNELVLGIVLGNWLLLTGFGAYCGRLAGRLRNPVAWLVAAQVVIALLPLAHISAIRMLNIFFLPGLMLGLGETFALSLLVLFPYCLVTGFLLTLFSGLGGERRDAAQIGEVYVIDVIGDIIGGILFSFVLVSLLSSYETLTLLLGVNLFAAALVCRSALGNKAAALVAGIFICSVSAALFLDLEGMTARIMFPGQQIIAERSTPYGRLAVTRSANQVNVYGNGLIVGSTGNAMGAEESVHYGLSQHQDPKVILLVSGGLNGGLFEAVKYPAARIDYVEPDPAVIDLVRQYAMPGEAGRITMIAEDARRFLRSKTAFYDAVLINLPDPSTAQLNRFYTVEFFKEVRNALKHDGVFSFSMSGAENYAAPEISYLTATVYQSLASVFAHILIIPGQDEFFLASGRPLDYQIGDRLKEKGIATVYVTDDYLGARLSPDRIAAASEMAQTPAGLNRDFRPAGYYILMRHWLARFQGSLVLPLLFMAGIALAIALLSAGQPGRSVRLAVAASGFSGLGLEVVLLVAFQVCFGYVYQQMSLIFTGFLLGTALGGAWTARRSGNRHALMLGLDLLLALAAVSLAFVLPVIRNHSPVLPLPPPLLFAGMTAFIGFLAGAQFPVAARLTFLGTEETAGSLYTLDYLGAALGGLAISTFAIPLLGITQTCWLLGGVKLASASLLWLQRAEKAPEPGTVRRHGAGVFPALATLFAFSALGVTMYSDASYMTLYALSFAPLYHWLLLLLVMAGILQAMGLDVPGFGADKLKNLAQSVFRRTWIRAVRWLHFAAFSVVVFFPLFRCYFKIPYLFCHACPRQCVFGLMRPYLVPAALIMNLADRHWCLNCCPLGTMFDCQAQAAANSRRLPGVIRKPVGLAVLAFSAYSYFRIRTDLAEEAPALNDWYTLFFANAYAPATAILAVAAVIAALSFRLRRPFCDCLCPVGITSEWIRKGENRLVILQPAAGRERGVS